VAFVSSCVGPLLIYKHLKLITNTPHTAPFVPLQSSFCFSHHWRPSRTRDTNCDLEIPTSKYEFELSRLESRGTKDVEIEPVHLKT
jgi:hypothetical protein